MLSLQPLEPRTLLSTYYLSPTGSDSAAGSLDAPWQTLAAAAARVSSGDELVLRGGNYAGGTTFNTPNLLIRSQTGERAVITSPNNDANVAWALRLDIDAHHVTLRGLELVGGYYYCIKTETTWGYGGGTPLYGSTHLTIDTCWLHGSGRDAVKIVPGAHHVTVKNSEIYNTGLRDPSNAEGIDNVNGDFMVVRDCYIHDIATTGVYAKGGAANCLIERNRIENTGVLGIALGFYTDAEFFDADNTAYYESIDSTVRNNVIINSFYAGIGLYAALRPNVFNNTLIGVARGGQSGITLAPGTVWVSDTHTAYAPNRDVQIHNNIVTTTANAVGLRIRVVDGFSALEGGINIDNNLYYYSGGAVGFRDDRTGFAGNLAGWRAHVGGETGSKEANPNFASGYRIGLSSPALNAGRTLIGLADDIQKQSRPQGAAWDIGADELVSDSLLDTTAPTATLNLTPKLTTAGGTNYKFTVTFSDNVALNVATFDGHDILVTGPNGFMQLATLFRVDQPGNGATRQVTYRVAAPGGSWDAADNGLYTITLRKRQVTDTAGNFAASKGLGQFLVKIPAPSVFARPATTSVLTLKQNRAFSGLLADR